jgi:hypothetical protein
VYHILFIFTLLVSRLPFSSNVHLLPQSTLASDGHLLALAELAAVLHRSFNVPVGRKVSTIDLFLSLAKQ